MLNNFNESFIQNFTSSLDDNEFSSSPPSSDTEVSSSSASSSSFFLQNDSISSLYFDLEHAAFKVLSPQETLIARAQHEMYSKNSNNDKQKLEQTLSDCVQTAFVESLLKTNVVSSDSLRAVSGIVSSFKNNSNNTSSTKMNFISTLPNNSILLTPACVVVSFWRERKNADQFVENYAQIDRALRNNNNNNDSSGSTCYWLQTLSSSTKSFVIGGTGIHATAIALPPIRHRLFSSHDQSMMTVSSASNNINSINHSNNDDDDDTLVSKLNSIDMNLALEMKSWKDAVSGIFNDYYHHHHRHQRQNSKNHNTEDEIIPKDVLSHPHSFSVADGCEGIPILIRPSEEMLDLTKIINIPPKNKKDHQQTDEKEEKITTELREKLLPSIAKVFQNYILSNKFLIKFDQEANTFNRRRAWEWLRETLNRDLVSRLEKDLILSNVLSSRISLDENEEKEKDQIIFSFLRELGLFVEFSHNENCKTSGEDDDYDEQKSHIFLSLDPPAPSTHHHNHSSSSSVTSNNYSPLRHPRLQVIGGELTTIPLLENNNKNTKNNNTEEPKAPAFTYWQQFWIKYRNDDADVAPLHVINHSELIVVNCDSSADDENDQEEDEEMQQDEKADNIKQPAKRDVVNNNTFDQKRRQIEESIQKYGWKTDSDNDDYAFFHRDGCMCCNIVSSSSSDNEKDDDVESRTRRARNCGWVILHSFAQDYLDNKLSDHQLSVQKQHQKSQQQKQLQKSIIVTSSSSSSSASTILQTRSNHEWCSLAHAMIDFVINEIERLKSQQQDQNELNKVNKATMMHNQKQKQPKSSSSLSALQGSLFGIALRILLWTNHPSSNSNTNVTSDNHVTDHQNTLNNNNISNTSSASSSLSAALLPCYYFYFSKSLQHNVAKYFLDVFVPDECSNRKMFHTSDFILEEELNKKLKKEKMRKREIERRKKNRKVIVTIADAVDVGEDEEAMMMNNNNNIDDGDELFDEDSDNNDKENDKRNLLLAPRPPSSSETSENITLAIASLTHHFENYYFHNNNTNTTSHHQDKNNNNNNNNNNNHHDNYTHQLLPRLQRSIILPLAFCCLRSSLGSPNILFSEELANVLAFKYCPLIAKRVSEEVNRRLNVVRKRGDLLQNDGNNNSTTKTMMSLLYSSSLMMLMSDNKNHQNDSTDDDDVGEIRQDLMYLLLTAGFATLSLLCPSLNYKSMVKPSHLYLESNPHSKKESNADVIVCTSRLRRMLWKIFHLVVLNNNNKKENSDNQSSASSSLEDDEEFFHLFEAGGTGAKNFTSTTKTTTENEQQDGRYRDLKTFIKRRKFALIFEDLPLLILSCSMVLQNYQQRQQLLGSDAHHHQKSPQNQNNHQHHPQKSASSSIKESRSTKEKALYFIMEHIAVNYAQSSTSRCLTAAAKRIQRLVRSRTEFRINVALLKRRREYVKILKEESVASAVIRWKIDQHHHQEEAATPSSGRKHHYDASLTPSKSPFVMKKRSLIMMNNNNNNVAANQDHDDTTSRNNNNSSKQDKQDLILLETFIDSNNGDVICPALKKRMEERLSKKKQKTTTTAADEVHQDDDNNNNIMIPVNFHEAMQQAEEQQIKLDHKTREERFEQVKKNQLMILERRNLRQKKERQLLLLIHNKGGNNNNVNQDHKIDEKINEETTIIIDHQQQDDKMVDNKKQSSSNSVAKTHHEVKNEIPNTKESLSARRKREVDALEATTKSTTASARRENNTNNDGIEDTTNENSNNNHHPETTTATTTTTPRHRFYYPSTTGTEKIDELEEVIELDYVDVCAIRIQSCWRCFVARTEFRLKLLEQYYFSSVAQMTKENRKDVAAVDDDDSELEF